MKIRFKKLFKYLPFFVAIRLSFLVLIKKTMANEANIYFSQTGEDIVLKYLLAEKENGTYVDVGCNEPISFSNTFYLYCMGWKGICIDANEALCKKFINTRPRDIVVNAAISDEDREVTFFVSDKTPAVSTIDQVQLKEWKKYWEFNREVKILTQRVEKILDQYLPPEKTIDLMSIDVEGHDLEALRSVNLNKYRPRFIVIEIHDFKLSKKGDHAIVNHLSDQGYELHFYSTINGYFKDTRVL
jgi:FkbM family methyltransferase